MAPCQARTTDRCFSPQSLYWRSSSSIHSEEKDKLWRILTEDIESSRMEFHERSSRNSLDKDRRNPQMTRAWRDTDFVVQRRDQVIETSEFRSRLTWARCFINSIGTRRGHAPYSSKTNILSREREAESNTISLSMTATIELVHGKEICSLMRW